MVISNKPVQYLTDDRDGNHKFGTVLIKALEYTRDIPKKVFRILVVDYVDGLAIKTKIIIKSYAEIDGLRQMLLSSGKDYSEFTGSSLEDELLADAMLMLVKQAGHYHTVAGDWIRYVEPVISEPEIGEIPPL